MKVSGLDKILTAAARRGWFGRRAQVEALIPLGKAERRMTGAERSACIARFHQQYPNCSGVQLHSFPCSRIGELISRWIAIAIDAGANAENGIIHVYVPLGEECNSRLMRIMRRQFTIISNKDAAFWKAILMGTKDRLWENYLKYNVRREDLAIPSEILDNLIVLSDEELAEAEEKMRAMGLHQPYVCISSRDVAYLKKTQPENDCFYHDYRDSKITMCSKAAEYLKDQRIQTVRVGRYVKGRADFSSCIDYANDYYDELLDIALPKFSKFFLSDSNGINLLGYASNVPVALKNLIPLNDGWGSIPQSDKGLFICKRYFLKAENRYLSIREILDLEARGGDEVWYTEFYQKNGIEVVENTAEDILDLVTEMNERLDGTWEETEESIQMQERVQKMLHDDMVRTGKEYHACLHCNISINFLKHNPFLLDP